MLNEYFYCNVISVTFVEEMLEPSSGQEIIKMNFFSN